jgi:DNA polymerase/3'-5' exonuclease PolX
MAYSNADAAAVFNEIADLLEVQGGNAFRVRAYRNAARTLADRQHGKEGRLRTGRRTPAPGTRRGTPQVVEQVRAELPHGFSQQVADKILSGLLASARTLERMAPA